MAYKVILKHSSILGKRPTNENIQPGELALNTNSEDPGAFFEVSDGNVVKVGPTSVSDLAPVAFPEKGESWYDTANGTLNIGTLENSQKVWKSIAAPYLGGSDIVVFVAPDFYASTDSLLNDGQALPFQTLNRAIIEVTKLRIFSYISNGRNVANSQKYVIFFAPSVLSVFNDPGTTVNDFSVVFQQNNNQSVTVGDLVQFNSTEGGLIVPGNVSIKGLEIKKCEMKPSYVPTYRHPGYPAAYAGENQSLSSMLKVAGNVSCGEFSVTDKISAITVIKVSDNNGVALFKSQQGHGLSKNNLLDVSFAPSVDQSTGTFAAGQYYATPVDSFHFYLSEEKDGAFVPFSAMPIFNSGNYSKLFASLELKSAHRLSVFKYTSFQELADLYTKVQKAFPSFFGGAVTNGNEIVSSEEYIIVAPSDTLYPDNLSSNSTKYSSCYLNRVNLRSDYGMTYGDFNGDEVEGFRSLIANECTAVSLQKDPAAYEIYTTLVNPTTGVTEQKWWTLAEATYYSIPVNERPDRISEVPWSVQLRLLNSTPIEKIRYYYQSLTTPEGQNIGITDINNDFRHYGVRARNSSYVQAQSIYTIGCAIGVWSMNGAIISLTNSTSNFGSVAFKSEGFRGINTIGGAFANAKGFQFSGIQRPLSLSEYQILDIENKNILSLGSRIVDSYVDPANPNIQILSLSSSFFPCYILPFSLKPGSAVWVSSSKCTYRGFLADDGGPTVLLESGPCGQTAKLRIRYSDSTIPTDSSSISLLDIPYIRRFKDPRTLAERSYQFVVVNTDTNAVAPAVGSVLRLNQTSQTQGASTLRPNVQFDPGTLGGWGRLFTIDAIQTLSLGSSPNFNYVVGNATQDNSYLMTITAGDIASPWLQSKTNYAQGSCCTYANRNWYAAENNLWQDVYYNATFSSTVGPYKIAPTESCSPYVPTNVLERQSSVADTYQGSYAQDPNLSSLSENELQSYLAGTYLRGSMIPYTEYAVQNYYDDDDGTDGMGMILKDQTSGKTTILVSPINPDVVVPPVQFPPGYGSVRVSPEVVEFFVLSSTNIENPKQTKSVLKIEQGPYFEYLQVINLVGTRVTAIRLDSSNSYFPDPVGESIGEKPIWIPSTVNPPTVNICTYSELPDPATYDPDWGNTKYCVFRFFEVMGYPNTALAPLLKPQYWGERFLPVGSIAQAPSSSGYALTTSTWPLEFNQPSTIIANTHTWAYCGYPFYSQGLPKFQTNDISRKLGYDYLATALWSGRLTITGISDKGEIVLFGPQREAITSQYYELEIPTINVGSRQVYKEQPIVEFPGQVVVYTTDNINSQFDGISTSFPLTKGGVPLPPNHLVSASMWVQLGGVTQYPETNYTISSNVITFSEAPDEGLSCDIRVVTSEDSEKTLVVVPLEIVPSQPIDGSRSIFTLTSPSDIRQLEINSENTIVILGGVEQLPQSAYSMSRLSPTQLQITFTGVPPINTSVDIRSICSGPFWSTQGIEPVAVYSLDDISPDFSNPGQTTFPLTFEGSPVNPALITSENMFVNLGGAIQVPLYTSGNTTNGSYNVSLDLNNQPVIVFQEAPPEGATIDIRVVTNAEFLPCLNDRGREVGFLKWGPSVVLNLEYEVNNLEAEINEILSNQ